MKSSTVSTIITLIAFAVALLCFAVNSWSAAAILYSQHCMVDLHLVSAYAYSCIIADMLHALPITVLYIILLLLLLQLGASPDGVFIEAATGTVRAVVEVKCHAPFVSANGYSGSSSSRQRAPRNGTNNTTATAASNGTAATSSHAARSGDFALHCRGSNSVLGAWHVPQVILLNFCKI
jgi:hypothetical protein